MVNKKAITPIIAVVLLVLMTVGVAASVMVWLQNFMASSTERMEGSQIGSIVFDVDIHYKSYNTTNLTVLFRIVNRGFEVIDPPAFDIIIQKKAIDETTYRTIKADKFKQICGNVSSECSRLSRGESCIFECEIDTGENISLGDEFVFTFAYKDAQEVVRKLAIEQ